MNTKSSSGVIEFLRSRDEGTSICIRISADSRGSPNAGPPDNPPDIATTADSKLKAEQRQPKLALHNTPGGTIEQNVHTNVEEQREARIRNLEERLGSAQKKFESNFRASARKSSKDDFNRASKGRSR